MTNSSPTKVVLIQMGSIAAGVTPGKDTDALVLTATTSDELVSAKTRLVPSTLERLEIVVSASDLSHIYKPMDLATFVPFLQPGACVSVQVLPPGQQHPAAENQDGNTAPAVATTIDLQPVHTSFLLAGLKGVSEKRESDGSRVLTASLTKVHPVTAASAPLRTNGAAVTINIDGGDDDMIDEDDLLNSDLLAPPPAMNEVATASATDDCAGRKPCDNCTCGRADAEAGGGAAAVEQKNAPSSSCGKCSLGDAFRCASCPYLGKPAFKPGEEHLVLQMTDDL